MGASPNTTEGRRVHATFYSIDGLSGTRSVHLVNGVPPREVAVPLPQPLVYAAEPVSPDAPAMPTRRYKLTRWDGLRLHATYEEVNRG